MVICIDFDGSCVTHEYPNMGKDIGAQPVLKRLVSEGHELILWTMRDRETLQDAIGWFAKNEIPLYGIQRNPEQSSWTSSPKALADLYIDDAGIGCPLVRKRGERPYIDWEAISKYFWPD